MVGVPTSIILKNKVAAIKHTQGAIARWPSVVHATINWCPSELETRGTISVQNRISQSSSRSLGGTWSQMATIDDDPSPLALDPCRGPPSTSIPRQFTEIHFADSLQRSRIINFICLVTRLISCIFM
jgi:hypothetical protein